MSGAVKAVKKVFKGVGKAVKKTASAVAKGARKIVKSKVFKYAVIAGATYFGGAGIASMMNGGTFAAGVGSAAGSLTSAGSSLMNLQFGQAASTVSSAWGTAATTGASLGASGTMSAGFAAATGASQAIAPTFSAVQGTAAATAQMSPVATTMPQSMLTQSGALSTQAVGGGVTNVAGSAMGGAAGGAVGSGLMSTPTNTVGEQAVTKAVETTTPVSTGMSMGKGLMYSAGINAGSQAVGGYMNAKAQEEQIEDERDRRDFNMRNKKYSASPYLINSAFTPMTVDQLRNGG